MRGRRVLITGAGGFVGRALVTGFADLGWQVTGLDRSFDGVPERGHVQRVDAELADAVPAGVPPVDLVVHAAWVTTDPGAFGVSRAGYASLNVRPLMAVLEYAARVRPASFVFLSSSGVFAAADASEGLTDTTRPTGTSPYAVTKRAAEVLVPGSLEACTTAHVVRLGYLFGPTETPRSSRTKVSLVAEWVAAARGGRPLEVRADDPRRDWTLASDLAGALERVAEGQPIGQPVHLGSGHVLRDSTLATLVASRFPGSETVTVPADERVKPPMVPSDIPGLRGFPWTDPTAALERILAAGEAT